MLNNLCGWAWTLKEIRMESDGTPWRPLVHALDICQAIALTLEAPRDVVHNQVMNVGDPSGNYRIRELAEIVGGVFPACEVTVGTAVATIGAIASTSARSMSSSQGSPALGLRSSARGSSSSLLARRPD